MGDKATTHVTVNSGDISNKNNNTDVNGKITNQEYRIEEGRIRWTQTINILLETSLVLVQSSSSEQKILTLREILIYLERSLPIM